MMNNKIIFLIGLTFLFGFTVFVSAQEFYPIEFTLAIGEEYDFPGQGIIIGLKDITTLSGIQGYIANLKVVAEPSEEESIFGLWLKDDVGNKGRVYSKKTTKKWEIELIEINSEKARFKINVPEKSIGETSCVQSCKLLKVEKCATYPDSPLCLEGVDIVKECELSCQSEITLLNREFNLDIGQTV